MNVPAAAHGPAATSRARSSPPEGLIPDFTAAAWNPRGMIRSWDLSIRIAPLFLQAQTFSQSLSIARSGQRQQPIPSLKRKRRSFQDLEKTFACASGLSIPAKPERRGPVRICDLLARFGPSVRVCQRQQVGPVPTTFRVAWNTPVERVAAVVLKIQAICVTDVASRERLRFG